MLVAERAFNSKTMPKLPWQLYLEARMLKVEVEVERTKYRFKQRRVECLRDHLTKPVIGRRWSNLTQVKMEKHRPYIEWETIY